MNESQIQVACIPSHQIQSRWLSAMTSLDYRVGHLQAYLAELVSGLRHGLGASQVMLGQDAVDGYRFTVSPDLHSESPQDTECWSSLAHNIVNQKIPAIGTHPLQASLVVAYCGVPLSSPHGNCSGILLALRPAIEPFQLEQQQVLTLMATQAAMAIEIELQRCSSTLKPPSATDTTSDPLSLLQGNLLSINQQLTRKLDHYRAELQQVSAQLQLERMAHSSLEQRFRKIFEGSNDAIFVIDPAQDRILEANLRATQLLNYSRQELLNSIKISQIHPDEMPKLMAFTQSVFRQGQGWTDELTCLTKHKHQLSAEISAAPLEFEGQQCMITMVRDISTRKCLEAERQQAEANATKALAHLAEVGELASMIVHEIRNPLTTILMGLTSFQKLKLDSRFQSRLDIALEEAERLKRLLNEILLLSKPQTLDRKPIELNQWSTDLLASLQSHPAVTDRVIRFNANPISTIVAADSDKLKQVFINLITNACEAVRAGEKITWDISHSSKAEHVTVRINNGGNPIPPSILEKITTPFFTTKSHGNGLGLAIVKRILLAHKGQFTIASDAVSGTTVTIQLPLLIR